MRVHFYMPLFLLIATNAFCQKSELDSLVDKKLYSKNIKIYRTILKDGPNNDVTLKLADALRLMDNNQEASVEYAKVIDRPDISPIYYKHYSEVLCKIGQPEECKRWSLRYKEYEKRADKTSDAVIDIDTSKYFINRSPFNSPETDFGPAFYKNGLLYISAYSPNSKKTVHAGTGESFYNFYYAEKKPGGGFFAPTQVFKSINSTTYEGPASLTADNSTIFLNRNNLNELKVKTRDKRLILQIVQGKIVNDEITNISDFPYNDKAHTCTHPSISADGKELYFTSNMDSTQGGSDIFVSKWINGTWSAPENLGSLVNTANDEVYPFISTDGKLYFSSTGHGSMGGFDVFMSERRNGKWTKPTNLGIPFNTIFDDFSLIKNEETGEGYLASNRASSLGSDDIFTFQNAYRTAEEEVKYYPLLISLVNKDYFIRQKGNKIKGKLTPKSDGVSMTGSVVQLLDRSKTILKRCYVTQDGYFSFSNLKPDNYLIEYEKQRINAHAELSMINKQSGFVDLEELNKYKIGIVIKDSLGRNKNNFVVGKLVTLNKNAPEEQLVSLILVDSTGKIIRRIEVGRNNYFIFRDLPTDQYFVMTEDNDPNYTCNIFYHNSDKSLSINKADLLSYHYQHLNADSLKDNNIILHGRVKLDSPEGNTVLLLDRNDNVIDKTVTNPKGYFMFRELDGENMHVVVMNDQSMLSFNQNTVYQREDTVYHITKNQIQARLPFADSLLSKKVIVNGRLTSGNKPLKNKLILLANKLNIVTDDATTNEDGFFAFQHLTPDDYYIMVDERDPGYMLERQINKEDDDMMVTENDFKEFDNNKMDKEQFLSIQGNAYNKASQKPIIDKLLLLLDKDGKVIRQTVTGKNGKFTFVNLKPDTYLTLFHNYEPEQKINRKIVQEAKTKVTQTKNGKKEVISLPIAQVEDKLIIFFDYNNVKLEAKYIKEITKFCKMLQEAGAKEVELYGFADMVGSDSFNLNLAEKRIMACVEVIKKATPTLYANEIPEGRTNKFMNTYGTYIPALNRRVELRAKE